MLKSKFMCQSKVILRSVMIFFHLADSLANMVVNWAGVPPTGSMPKRNSLSITSGSLSTWLAAVLMRLTTSVGRFLGPKKPNQVLDS